MTHDLSNASVPPSSTFRHPQLNIITVVDVSRLQRTGSVNDAVFLLDNSPSSTGKGTPHLETACAPGQVLNWLIYGIDSQRRSDGSWPTFPSIATIVFLHEDSDAPSAIKVSSDLKTYGMPDRVRNPLTPTYRYWAGGVTPDLAPGRFRYRLVLDVPDAYTGTSRYFEVSSAALRVVAPE
ncbi:MAG: hypothetical protein NTZ03_13820 [Actinobacteria bacterium]|nr:hypothetical protein [Actinomycetota bacterium]